MVYIIVFLAFILTWFFIEITLFLSKKNSVEINNNGSISYKQFIWTLRILAIFLFLFTSIYMFNFNNGNLIKAVEYCLGIIK